MGSQLRLLTLTVVVCFACCASVFAQTTAFTYQGKLGDGGSAATGTYDFQFKLYNALTDGSLQGTPNTVTKTGVQVNAGTFTVQLDFGAGAFPGGSRFLEISVKRPADSSYTPLSPRQPITSTPYAQRSLNAEAIFIGGQRAFGVTGTATSPNSNTFAGVGAGINNTPGVPDLPSGLSNSFFGAFAGVSNTEGAQNSFFGERAGFANTIGSANSFFGLSAGLSNTEGVCNSFIGGDAGSANTEGSFNTFLGQDAGRSNTREHNNTFVGARSNGQPGITNATAIGFGAQVTQSNSLVLGANAKVGIGTTAPAFKLEVVEPSNTGLRVQTNTSGGTVASFGSNGDFRIDRPNVQGGRFTVSENGNVGIGTGFAATPANPTFKLQVIDASNTGLRVQTNATGGTVASFGGNGAFEIDANGEVGGRFTVSENGTVGVGTNSPLGKLQVVTADDTNPLFVTAWDNRHFVVGGSASSGGVGWSYDQANDVGYISSLSPNVAWRHLVLQAGGGNVGIGTFTTTPAHKLHVNGTVAGVGPYVNLSDLRYKHDIRAIEGALSKVRSLRGVTFDWRREEFPHLDFATGRSVGFVAQEVERVVPEAVTRDAEGFRSVAYSHLTPVLVEAVKEQQAQIENQQKLIETQQSEIELQGKLLKQQQIQIDLMKKLICSERPNADLCKEGLKFDE